MRAIDYSNARERTAAEAVVIRSTERWGSVKGPSVGVYIPPDAHLAGVEPVPLAFTKRGDGAPFKLLEYCQP